MKEMLDRYNILIGIPEGRRPLVKSEHKWEDNFKMDLKVIRFESAGWIHVATG
jgi:hypothetical protein